MRASPRSLLHTLVGVSVILFLCVFFLLYSSKPKCRHKDSQTKTDSDKEGNLIPARIIHQTWKTTKLPPRFSRWASTWRRCFPNWKYRIWNDTENHDFVKNYYPWFYEAWSVLPENINRVDAVRYLYLFHYGGIYTDLDNECLQPFEHLLSKRKIVFGAMTGQYVSFIPEGYVQNSFMYSEPRHPFWLEMVHEIILRKKSTRPAEAIAGPITLVDCINKYRGRLKDNEDIKIYPPIYFNPNSWLKNRAPGCKDFNAMTVEEEMMCKRNYNTSYVIQYHTQTWARGHASRR